MREYVMRRGICIYFAGTVAADGTWHRADGVSGGAAVKRVVKATQSQRCAAFPSSAPPYQGDQEKQ